jgi:Global regulator protein family
VAPRPAMLLLSRKLNESVVIGGRLVVTVAGITAAAVEVSIQDGDAAPAKAVLTPDGYRELGLGVRAVVVNVRPLGPGVAGRARLKQSFDDLSLGGGKR